MTKSRGLADLGNVYNDGALSNRNKVINGAMVIAQYGTSVTAAGTGAYAVTDRFKFQTNLNTNSVLSQVTDAPDGFSYSYKLTVGTGATPAGSDYGRFYHRLEGYNSNQFNLGSVASEAITLSFWVKASIAGTYGVKFAGDGAGSYSASYTVNVINIWEQKTVTIPAGVWTTYNGSTTNGTGFQIAWDLGEGPSRSDAVGYGAAVSSGSMGLTGGVKILATTSATWQITGVQLEVGDTATPFEHRSYGQELALCQRYYRDLCTGATNVSLTNATYYNTTSCYGIITLPVTMRATPTLATSSPAHFKVYSNQANAVPSSVSLTGSSDSQSLEIFMLTSARTAGDAAFFRTDSSSASLQLDAEL